LINPLDIWNKKYFLQIIPAEHAEALQNTAVPMSAASQKLEMRLPGSSRFELQIEFKRHGMHAWLSTGLTCSTVRETGSNRRP
jgi:hypothetical protein